MEKWFGQLGSNKGLIKIAPGGRETLGKWERGSSIVAEHIKVLTDGGADPALGTERDGWGPGYGAASCPLLAQHQELLNLPPAWTRRFGKYGRGVK